MQCAYLLFLAFRGDITMGTAIFFTCTAFTWLKYCQYRVTLSNQLINLYMYIYFRKFSELCWKFKPREVVMGVDVNIYH